MAWMRLGTRCAILDEDENILLSRRSDFNNWVLPGGRLDSGELLPECAVREVKEETGLDVKLLRPVGMYYQRGRGRMDVLYEARIIGGTLLRETPETLDNRFFDPEDLPEDRYGDIYIQDAYQPITHVKTVLNTRWELIIMDMHLVWRWLKNWFAGNPEPPFPRFSVHAVALVFDPKEERLLTLDGELPRFESDGLKPLQHLLSQHLDKYGVRALKWRWIGLWQDTETDTLDFILTATRYPSQQYIDNWIPTDDISGTGGRAKTYLKAYRNQAYDDVWFITENNATFSAHPNRWQSENDSSEDT